MYHLTNVLQPFTVSVLLLQENGTSELCAVLSNCVSTHCLAIDCGWEAVICSPLLLQDQLMPSISHKCVIEKERASENKLLYINSGRLTYKSVTTLVVGYEAYMNR